MKSETRFYSQNKHGWMWGTPSVLPQCQRLWRWGNASPDVSPASPKTWPNVVSGTGLRVTFRPHLHKEIFWRMLFWPKAICQSSVSVGPKFSLSALSFSSRGWMPGLDKALGMVLDPYHNLNWTRAFFRRMLSDENKIMTRSKLTDLCASSDQCRHKFCIPQWSGNTWIIKQKCMARDFRWVSSRDYLNETSWNFHETWWKGILQEAEWVSPRKEKKILVQWQNTNEDYQAHTSFCLHRQLKKCRFSFALSQLCSK